MKKCLIMQDTPMSAVVEVVFPWMVPVVAMATLSVKSEKFNCHLRRQRQMGAVIV